MRWSPLICLAILLNACTNPANQQPPVATILSQENIAVNPAFASCHASTIVDLPGNRLLAAWFAGPHESHKEVLIYTALHENGKWSEPKAVADGIQNDTLRYPTWNPVLFQIPGGDLLLFFKIGLKVSDWSGWLVRSKDGGKTWSKREPLPEGFLGPIKNKPEFVNGRIICPSSTEGSGGWQVHFEISDDISSSITDGFSLLKHHLLPKISFLLFRASIDVGDTLEDEELKKKIALYYH